MAGISIEMATLVAAFLEVFLYGLYIMLFGRTVQLMLGRPGTSTSFALWFGIGFLFALATMHIGVTLRRFVNAFVVLRNAPGGPTTYITDQTEWLSLFSLSIYGVSTLIGDCLVVWRCFIVWGRRWWIVAVFGTMICALEVCGVSVMIQISRLESVEAIFATKITDWFEAFVILSMSNNILVSALIIYRLLNASKDMGSLGANHSRRYRRLALVILESASIYPMCMIVYLAVYRSGSQAHWILNTIMVQVLAIVPCLMVYAVLTNKNEETTFFRSTASVGNRWPSRFRAGRPRDMETESGDTAQFQAGEMALSTKVKVDTATTIDIDDMGRHENMHEASQ